MKVFSLLVGAAGVLIVTGFPAHITAAPSRLAIWEAVSHGPVAATVVTAIPDPDARWTECGSLLLLATGMFGAAVLVARARP
jgi:hypothetical protein